ncbi:MULTISPECIES: class I SAM-dependent methyltransferase [unclassified Ensifer]|uniref:class I SAM-dependent methyltransferase n=1 Tax=unclassified Ensifer TaxID=2633371 RepID=UPI000813CEE3|nr:MULTISPECIES: class I SAM-dependent methyltransferase [unclassified Ensifer]OCO99010.1 SAM-dependent methyltransferase [Ensifer sp. LC14]OCP11369.1 SAM-dependent methyltransferase [Ensifer sp. LC13]OCP11988.1 SAM-dependent methyltransferase [Ensifer sp. LC11]OCP33497.1 SAM-dependent methyltransferase [Ensifer sp. LC499]
MHDEDRRVHWDNAYQSKGEAGVSWYEDTPAVSLDLIRKHATIATSSLIDIGGGASRLVDALLDEGMKAVAVLDLSPAALEAARARLGGRAGQVDWIAADVTGWTPERTYDIWHDRAAFHFLTDPVDRAAYVKRLTAAVAPGGHAIIATFAPDGPERCSGLPVVRYDPAALAETIGLSFRLVEHVMHQHTTPWNSTQSFQFSVLERVR